MSRESDGRTDGDPNGRGGRRSMFTRGGSGEDRLGGTDAEAVDGTGGDAVEPSGASTDGAVGTRPDPARDGEDEGVDDDDGDRDVARRVQRLEAENSRLREAYARAVETNYRRTAAGFALVGAVAALSALVFPDARDVLVALAGTGLFAAVLTLYLSPERFVAADVGERVYAAQARNHERLVAELGVSDHRLYLPAAGERVATLFVPQFDEYVLPEGTLEETLVVPDEQRARGLAFTPTGEALFEAVERSLGGSIADRPGPLLDQLSEALVATFEVVDATDVEVAPDGDGADVAVYGSVYGDGTRFDDPVVSLLAVGLAVALDRPVRATVSGNGDVESDADGYVASFRWTREETPAERERRTEATSTPSSG